MARRGGRARLKASDSKSDRGASPSGVQILSPPPIFFAEYAVNAGSEGWPSGRRCGTGNAVYGQLYRGFESHPLRHFLDLHLEAPAQGSGARGSGSQPEWRLTLPVGEKGPVARRRPKTAGEAYSLYVEPAVEGANEANGPLSTTGTAWPC